MFIFNHLKLNSRHCIVLKTGSELITHAFQDIANALQTRCIRLAHYQTNGLFVKLQVYA